MLFEVQNERCNVQQYRQDIISYMQLHGLCNLPEHNYSTQSFILTEVDACLHVLTLCRHNVLNVRIVKVEMRRPSVDEDSFQCTFMACVSAALWSCIERIFFKLTWVEAIHTLRPNLTVYKRSMNIEPHNFNIEFRNQQLLFPE